MTDTLKAGDRMKARNNGAIYTVAKRKARPGSDPAGVRTVFMRSESGYVEENVVESLVDRYFERVEI